MRDKTVKEQKSGIQRPPPRTRETAFLTPEAVKTLVPWWKGIPLSLVSPSRPPEKEPISSGSSSLSLINPVKPSCLPMALGIGTIMAGTTALNTGTLILAGILNVGLLSGVNGLLFAGLSTGIYWHWPNSTRPCSGSRGSMVPEFIL